MAQKGGGEDNDSLSPDFLDFIVALNERKVDFVLVGGYALGIHGVIRATGDIDFLFRATKLNVRRLCEAMIDFGAPSVVIDEAALLKPGIVGRPGYLGEQVGSGRAIRVQHPKLHARYATDRWQQQHSGDGFRGLVPDRGGMPTLSRFYGITIRMYWSDHGPPHFHAVYAEHRAAISIQDLIVLRGGLPPRAAELTLEWARIHRTELLEAWRSCERNLHPSTIDPLE